MSYNKIIVMGRLVAPPEMRVIPSGTPVCEFRIAFDNGWGENKKPCFIGVTAWGKTAEFVEKQFSKGDGILIDGRLEFDQWEDKNTGDKRSKHYITAERITFPLSNNSQGKSTVDKITDTFHTNKPTDYSVKDVDEIPF